MKVFVALLIAAWSCAAQGSKPIPIILDTDIGDSIDDAMALAFALNSPELDVRAITTVIDDVESKSKLVWKMLGAYNKREIPLGTGEADPIDQKGQVHNGKEFDILVKTDSLPDAAKKRAVDLIIETIMKSQEKITIVGLGPLTNIALALKQEPKIKDKIERIVVNGVDEDEEYNLKRDPAATRVVFGSGLPITAISAKAASACRLREKDLAKLRVAEDPAGMFLMRLLSLATRETGEKLPTLGDPLTLAVVFRPKLIETRAFEKESTQAAVKTVDPDAFLDLFIGRVSGKTRFDLQ